MSVLKRRILGFIRIIRPVNGLMMSLAVFVGAWLSLNTPVFPDLLQNLLLGALTAFTLSGASMAINDYCDYEIDKINEPNRPLPSGVVKLEESLFLAAVMMLIGLVASLLINWKILLIALISISVSTIYAFRGKQTGLPGNMLVSFCVAIPFIYGSLIVSDIIDLKILLFSAMAFLSNIGREVTKGIVDVSGDRIKNMRTVAVIYGEKVAAAVASSMILSAVILSAVPPIIGIVSAWFIPFVAITDIGFILSSMMLIRNPTRQNAKKVKSFILLCMLMGMIAFIAGK